VQERRKGQEQSVFLLPAEDRGRRGKEMSRRYLGCRIERLGYHLLGIELSFSSRGRRMLGIELSLSLRGRMTLGVGAIFWFISHTMSY
jgi:hypothetical protein